jgi:signal transduction histidine kinase
MNNSVKLVSSRLILLFLVLCCLSQNLISENSRKIVLEKVIVNSKAIELDEFNTYIVTSDDTITIDFKLESGDNDKSPFVFKVSITDFVDSVSGPVSRSPIKYSNLKEGRYQITILAFDGLRKWETEPVVINLYSSRALVASRNKVALLNKKIREKDATIKQKEQEILKEKEAGGGTNLVSVIYGVVGTVLIGIIILFTYNATSGKSRKKGGINFKGKQLTEADIKILLEENENLKKELATLRGQIDSMQTRSEELNDKNKELEDSVTKLSKIKEDLENLQTQKDDLFAIIIHDIKNPAALIKSLVELLRSYDLTANEQQDIMNDILNTTSKIVSLSHEVSRVLALEGGKMRLELETNDPGEVGRDVFLRNQIKAKSKNITATVEIPPSLPDIKFDSQKIDEVLDNLLSNAIKFTNEGGMVKLTINSDNSNVIFEISDTGQGLTEDDIRNAFQRGAQLSAKPTKGESSTGLGLWIVKKLVEAHNGRVWVRSTVGKGSTFAFSIPIKELQSDKEVDLSQ